MATAFICKKLALVFFNILELEQKYGYKKTEEYYNF